jgi:hypothetical protein
MLRIHWWDVSKDRKADGLLLPPNSSVKLKSQHHPDKPVGYDVYELVPKVFHKLRGDREVKFTYSDSFPDPSDQADANSGSAASPVSVFWSDEFALRGPLGKQVGEVTYVPKLDGCDADNQEAFKVYCGHLAIKELRRGKHNKLATAPTLPPHLGGVKLGEISSEADWSALYEAFAAVDPRVEVSLLQGAALLDHLDAAAGRYIDTTQASSPFAEILSGDAATYFAGLPLSADSLSATADLGPDLPPLRIEVGVPASDDLRAAFSVKILDTEHGYEAVTDPVFLTAVRGKIIATDLSVRLLSEQSLTTLASLASANGSLVNFAQQAGSTVPEIWDRVVAATEELGAASVREAVGFVASALAIA